MSFWKLIMSSKVIMIIRANTHYVKAYSPFLAY